MIGIFSRWNLCPGASLQFYETSGGLRLVLGCRIGLESAIGAEKGVYRSGISLAPCMVDIRGATRALPDAVRE